jgi:hypothetical protein
LRTTSIVKLLTLFAIIFSLATLGGSLSGNFHLPTVPLANAVSQTGPCITTGSSGATSECWYPAGPEMNTMFDDVFTNEQTEYINLLGPNPSIDLTDWQVPAATGTTQLSGSGYYLTQTVPELGYYEVQFMQANTFWNCPFQYGNSACGINIRQGIAHMVDKTIFASQDPNIPAGTGTAIDNPLPTTSGGNLLSPNSCGWDSMFPETNTTGAPCTVGGGTAGTSIGGGAYHLATATGVSSISCPWCQAPGSLDLNAAAAHFVAAGLATGYNPSTSVLTGVISTTGITIPNFFVRNDNPPRLDLGNSLAEQICYLFTGSYTTPCAYLTTTLGSITQFLGFQTGTTKLNLSWWFYTGAYSGPSFYDGSLYFGYNSKFASASCVSPDTTSCTTQVIGSGYCSNSSVQTGAASDYMYICSPTYDSLSTGLETAPCLSAAGDPIAGQQNNTATGPNKGICPGTSTLSSHSAGIQAESYFGQSVLTLPFFQLKIQFGYLECGVGQPMSTSCNSSNTWQRIINNAGLGLPNSFTWLNAYNPSPATAGTIRQGFKESTTSINPYISSTVWDTYVEGNVYDTLYSANPLSTSTTQYFQWMTQSESQPTAVSYNGGLTGTPVGTCTNLCTYRFNLRSDLTWQDGTRVTAYDVAFSYLSMVQTGAFLGTGASTMSGITILNPTQFDISVASNGPFELDTITGIPILPGLWWSSAPSSGTASWASAVAGCITTACQDVQFTLVPSTTGTGLSVSCAGACSSFGGSTAAAQTLMTVNPTYAARTYDPIASHTFVGSGPWECGTVSSSGSGTCTPTGSGNGQSSYTLSAYTGYFRSSYRTAEWIWSQENDQTPVVAAAAVGTCFQVSPVSLSGSCGHWQQGIGNPGSGTIVNVPTVSTVDGLYGVNWVAPFNWASNPPLGIGAFPPILYALQTFDASSTLTPSPGPAYSPTGCTTANTYYNC